MMPFRLRLFAANVVLLALIATVSCSPAPPADSAASANPLQGVWSVTVSDPGDGSPAIDPSQPGDPLNLIQDQNLGRCSSGIGCSSKASPRP